jgi:hypothetical protein
VGHSNGAFLSLPPHTLHLFRYPPLPSPASLLCVQCSQGLPLSVAPTVTAVLAAHGAVDKELAEQCLLCLSFLSWLERHRAAMMQTVPVVGAAGRMHFEDVGVTRAAVALLAHLAADVSLAHHPLLLAETRLVVATCRRHAGSAVAVRHCLQFLRSLRSAGVDEGGGGDADSDSDIDDAVVGAVGLSGQGTPNPNA